MLELMKELEPDEIIIKIYTDPDNGNVYAYTFVDNMITKWKYEIDHFIIIGRL